jgi:hypothetical protein
MLSAAARAGGMSDALSDHLCVQIPSRPQSAPAPQALKSDVDANLRVGYLLRSTWLRQIQGAQLVEWPERL